MKFATGFIVSILTARVYGLATAPNAGDTTDFEARADAQACGDPHRVFPLRRAFDPRGIDYFYTTSVKEMQNAVTNHGYITEGITGFIFYDQEPHSVPLYRLNNSNIGDHIYTTSVVEANIAIFHQGYIYEGIDGYVYPDTACGGLALYRLHSNAGTDHLYTMSVVERDLAIIDFGYTQEGVTGYIFPF